MFDIPDIPGSSALPLLHLGTATRVFCDRIHVQHREFTNATNAAVRLCGLTYKTRRKQKNNAEKLIRDTRASWWSRRQHYRWFNGRHPLGPLYAMPTRDSSNCPSPASAAMRLVEPQHEDQANTRGLRIYIQSLTTLFTNERNRHEPVKTTKLCITLVTLYLKRVCVRVIQDSRSPSY
jgi:hypothetical protein